MRSQQQQSFFSLPRYLLWILSFILGIVLTVIPFVPNFPQIFSIPLSSIGGAILAVSIYNVFNLLITAKQYSGKSLNEADVIKSSERLLEEFRAFRNSLLGIEDYIHTDINYLRNDISDIKENFSAFDRETERLGSILVDLDHSLRKEKEEIGELQIAINDEVKSLAHILTLEDQIRNIISHPATANRNTIVFNASNISAISSVLHFQITEEPLMPQTLALTLTSLTEFTTKVWLIAKHRLADLIEYTQTHDLRFVYEVGIVITKVSYNSPFNFDWKVDISAPSFAEAIGTTIDAIKQSNERLKKLELDNQEKAQKIKKDEQKTELERMKEELALERERVQLLREAMDVQKQGIEYALEIASRLVEVLYPNADMETKGIVIRTLLPNILQLQNIKGLELVLPAPKEYEEEE